MNVAKLLEEREPEWKELETLTAEMRRRLFFRKEDTSRITRFVSLYRAACSDLALAESYHFPQGTIRYLNNLTGQAHHQLYRVQSSGWGNLRRLFFVDTPRWILLDVYFWVAMFFFWVPFLTCEYLAKNEPGFAASVVGEGQLENIEEMYKVAPSEKNPNARFSMVGFYIWNNCGIALRCFSLGVLGGIGGLFILLSNGVTLGVFFGHMTSTGVDAQTAANFSEFVTAHGPFELTGIVLSAAAGMRIGFAFIWTGGYRRFDSVRLAARKSLPIIATALFLIGTAALLEAFISPNPMFSWNAKKLIAWITSLLLICYIGVLGSLSWRKDLLKNQ